MLSTYHLKSESDHVQQAQRKIFLWKVVKKLFSYVPEDTLTILGQCKASIMVQETGKSKETFFIVTRNAQVPPVSNKRPFFII